MYNRIVLISIKKAYPPRSIYMSSPTRNGIKFFLENIYTNRIQFLIHEKIWVVRPFINAINETSLWCAMYLNNSYPSSKGSYKRLRAIAKLLESEKTENIYK